MQSNGLGNLKIVLFLFKFVQHLCDIYLKYCMKSTCFANKYDGGLCQHFTFDPLLIKLLFFNSKIIQNEAEKKSALPNLGSTGED